MAPNSKKKQKSTVLHVVLNRQQQAPGTRVALLQRQVRSQAQKLRDAEDILATFGAQIATTLSDRMPSRPSPDTRSMNAVAQQARQVVAADEAVSVVREAVRRQDQAGRLLDVNEQRQALVVRAIRNAQVRFGQLAAANRARLRQLQGRPEAMQMVYQTHANSLATAQDRVMGLRQNLQQLQDERLQLAAQYTEARQEAAQIQNAERNRQQAVARMVNSTVSRPPPVKPAAKSARKKPRRPLVW